MKINIHLWIYPLLLLLYGIYSYSHTDPNLYLSYHPVFLWFQQTMWELGQNHRLWSSLIFLGLVVGLFGTYVYLISLAQRGKLKTGEVVFLLVASVAALIFAYPALSHDVFNYLFNSKMVLVYKANPHVEVALNFAGDPWTRFMHNTHTPAPYGYGFTGLSLIPSFLGMGNLKLTLLLFRVLMLVSYAGVLMMQWILNPKANKRLLELVVFGLNPLILIEIIGNMHNDLTMMFLGLVALYLGQKAVTQNKKWLWLPTLLVFLMSVSIKYATLMMVGGLVWFYLGQKLKHKFSLGGALTIAHILPLFTKRSQRYLPWYLSWSMTFLPLVKEAWLVRLVIAASAAALLSYIPFLYRGEYTAEVILMRTMIVALPPLSLIITERLLTTKK